MTMAETKRRYSLAALFMVAAVAMVVGISVAGLSNPQQG
jgi:hypothetical protein